MVNLIEASVKGDIDDALSLLQQGANVNARDFHKHTPLMWATYRSHFEMVKLLLKHEANGSAKALDETDALYFVKSKKLNNIMLLFRKYLHLFDETDKHTIKETKYRCFFSK